MIKQLRKDTVSIIILGIIIRFLIIPFTFNWDLWANTSVATGFTFASAEEFYLNPLAVYPPMIYAILKFWLHLALPFIGSYLSLFTHIGSISAVTSPYIFRTLFVIKLPYMILEIICAFFFSQLFKGQKARGALLFWMLNPFSIFLISGWTNVDVIPVFALLLSLVLYQKNRRLLSSLALGVSVSFKLFPIFIFPFLFISLKNWKERILSLFLFMVPIIFSHISVITASSYLQHAITGGYSRKIFFSLLPIGDNRAILPFLLIYFLMFLFSLSDKGRQKPFIAFSFIALIPLFAFSMFNLQWFFWLLPFLIYYQIQLPETKIPLFFIYLSFSGLVILSQMSLNLGMLIPIEPTLITYGWPLKDIIGADNLFLSLNILHTFLAACLFWTGYLALSLKRKEDHAQT